MKPFTAADPLHMASGPETPWTMTNVAEAMPGVQAHSQITNQFARVGECHELLMLRRPTGQSVLPRVQFDGVGA